MKRLFMLLLGLAFVIGGVHTASAGCLQANSQAYVYLSPDATGYGCGIPTSGGIAYAYVFARPVTGIAAARFSVPVPTCAPGMQRLADMSEFPVTLGNSADGVSVGFGTCKTGSDFLVMTIMYYIPNAPQGCCPISIRPDPYADTANTGEIEFVDCNFELFTGGAWSTFVGAQAPPILKDPNPSDGAAEVPLDATLSWTRHICNCSMCPPSNQVYFGTTSDPPQVSYQDEDTYNPGPLSPSTTYYWKIKNDTTTSPVWSFTTVVGVPTESTTWGRVKALYGE